MVELKDTVDYVWLFLLAGGLGALGGLAFELMQTRRGQTGLLELPQKRGSGYRDLGVWANLVLGAIAAVAALWIFPPELHTTVAAGGATTTTTEYDLIKVVGLSLIVGSAGSSFLSALQARALARMKEQEAEVTRRVAKEQLGALESEIQAGASPERMTAQLEGAKAALRATDQSSRAGNPDFE